MIASPAREELKQELLNSPRLFHQIFMTNTAPGLRIPVGLFKMSPDGLTAERTARLHSSVAYLDRENLLNLDPEELLALRLDLGGNTEDHQLPCLLSYPLSNSGTPSGFEIVVFHPFQPVAAIRVSDSEFTVHSFSKDHRFWTGTQIFSHKIVPNRINYFRFAHDPELKFTGLRWSPDGRYLLASLGELAREKLDERSFCETMEECKIYGGLLLFEYRDQTVRQILFKEEFIRYDLIMLSHCQWLNNSSFLVPAPPGRTGLYRFQILINKEDRPELQVDRIVLDCHNPWRGIYSDLKHLNVQTQIRGEGKRQFMQAYRTFAYVGAYFGLGTEVKTETEDEEEDTELAVFGCVTGCPMNHVHPRLVIMKADKHEKGEVTAVIDVPGILQSVEVHENQLYILYIFELVNDQLYKQVEPAGCHLQSLRQGHTHEDILFKCQLVPGQGFKTLNEYHQNHNWYRTCRFGLAVYDYQNDRLNQINR